MKDPGTPFTVGFDEFADATEVAEAIQQSLPKEWYSEDGRLMAIDPDGRKYRIELTATLHPEGG